MTNIQKRGRDYESQLDEEYLQKLQDAYFQFMREQKELCFVVLDVSNLDFVKHNTHYESIKNKIFNHNYQKGINHVIF
jgi:deoxyadenosine/deoxycytidine kinase